MHTSSAYKSTFTIVRLCLVKVMCSRMYHDKFDNAPHVYNYSVHIHIYFIIIISIAVNWNTHTPSYKLLVYFFLLIVVYTSRTKGIIH